MFNNEFNEEQRINEQVNNKLFHQHKLFIFNHLEYVIQQHKKYKYKRAG